MVLDFIPVLPPDLRPIVELDDELVISDITELYRRIVDRNNRLKILNETFNSHFLIFSEKCLLQESVDSLFDNGRHGKPILDKHNRSFKSLAAMLKGKQGRFRQNLLGKRTDYSGRSVIVVEPELKLFQCGLPREMAIKLFRSFVVHQLLFKNIVSKAQHAENFIEEGTPVVWEILKEITNNYPIFLNRAPTLHKLGIQAFKPLLIHGKAIQLHPLVCTAYNADFDGDQMAVHIPLSLESQLESRLLMLSPNNFLSPATGKAILAPTQDMVLGCFYLTANNPIKPVNSKDYFASIDDALLAYQQSRINLQSFI
tara:strand:- start:311 stop:1249 length:939 start_codon:yes stop_codon:yes gene_type:complete